MRFYWYISCLWSVVAQPVFDGVYFCAFFFSSSSCLHLLFPHLLNSFNGINGRQHARASARTADRFGILCGSQHIAHLRMRAFNIILLDSFASGITAILTSALALQQTPNIHRHTRWLIIVTDWNGLQANYCPHLSWALEHGCLLSARANAAEDGKRTRAIGQKKMVRCKRKICHTAKQQQHTRIL